MNTGKCLLLAAALTLGSVTALAQNTIDKQGRRQGHWIRTDKDGSKIFEADYVDGLETGTSTYYYADGTVRIRNTYTEPGKRCIHEAYDERGRLLATGEYNQRNRDGLWRFYAEDGRLVKEAHYRMGIKDGQHTIFGQQGDTAEVTHWQNNHRHGRWWRRIGRKGYITGSYINGLMEGRLVEYDEEGRLAREGHYSGGLKHGTYRYYTNGRMTIDEHWNHGAMGNRKILLALPADHYESVHDIVCLMPQGKNRVLVWLADGTKLTVQESADDVYSRIGNELFAMANRKSNVMVALSAVQGIGKDGEGREVMLLDPQPDIPIFPDEDGKRMAATLRFGDNTPLDELQGR